MMENKKDRLTDLFDQARNEPSKISFDDMKEKFLTANASQVSIMKKLTQLFTQKSIIMFSIISAIVITAAVVTNNPEESKNRIEEKINVVEIESDSILIVEEQEKVIEEYNKEVELVKDHSELIVLPKIEPVHLVKEHEVKHIQPTFKIAEEPYRFPKLTEAEIKANNKQKAKMLKQLAKFNKKEYAYIPSGTYESKKKKFSVQAFYMQTTEVTNLEYRTFLFDLLIQNRKEDFLIASPKQQMWTEEYPGSFNKPMEENYFSHPAYDDYPVLAISREAVELYCVWITNETNKVHSSKYGFINDVRIPTEYEWIYAASGNQKNAVYPWPEITTQNADSCYLANYKPASGDFKSDGAFHTAKVSSYNPNGFGLYCMSGNVAEMIYYNNNDKKAPGTKGGSWTSNAEELMIEGSDPFIDVITPSVNIGFRVVITYIRN